MLQKNKINQYRGVIKSTLKFLDDVIPYSDFAVELIVATGVHEGRNFDFIKQIQGPAISPWQIEPATHNDIWQNYIKYRPHIGIKLLNLAGENLIFEYLPPEKHKEFIVDFINSGRHEDLNTTLLGNLYYAIAICRLTYFRKPTRLPNEFTIQEAAKIWKQDYNTILGKGHVEQFIRDYRNFVD